MSKFITINDKGQASFAFSKNKGTLLEDADQGFIKWCMNAAFIPDKVKSFIKDYLKNGNSRGNTESKGNPTKK